MFRFSFVFQNNSDYREIPIQQIGSMLTSLQTLFYAVGQYESYQISNNMSGRYNSRLLEIDTSVQDKNEIQIRKLTDSLKRETTLSLIDTFKGSFGIKLAANKLPQRQQLSLLDREEPLTEKISETFFNLIKKSNSKDKRELTIELQKKHRKFTSSYRNFLNNLIEIKSNVYVDWGSVNSNKGGRASLEYSEALATFEFIKKMELENSESYEIVGKLIAADGDRKTLKIENINTDEKIIAKISFDIDLNQENELTIGKTYSAMIIESLSTNSATGEEKIDYEITSIKIAKIL
jgi:hypothetical protein